MRLRALQDLGAVEDDAPLADPRLDGGVLAIEARVGKGRVILYGAEILQRAQPHGTFKLLFNALYLPASAQ